VALGGEAFFTTEVSLLYLDDCFGFEAFAGVFYLETCLEVEALFTVTFFALFGVSTFWAFAATRDDFLGFEVADLDNDDFLLEV